MAHLAFAYKEHWNDSMMTEQISHRLENREIGTPANRRNKMYSLSMGDFLVSFLRPFNRRHGGFLGGSVVKNLPCNAGNRGSVPGQRRSHMPWNS